MNQLTLEQEANKLSHRHDPDTSRDAAKAVVISGGLNKQEKEVYETLYRHDRGTAGYTAKELAYLMGGKYEKNYFKIQRRLSGLLRKGRAGRIRVDGTLSFEENPPKKEMITRDGCCVWAAKRTTFTYIQARDFQRKGIIDDT